MTISGFTQNIQEEYIFNSWESVREYLDDSPQLFSNSLLEKIGSGEYPADAFTLGQLASKMWLIKAVQYMRLEPEYVAILGAWFGSLAGPMYDKFESIKKIYGVDIDPSLVSVGDKFNSELVSNQWKYKSFVGDIDYMPIDTMMLEHDGEIIEYRPDTVINTSCEHMADDWFWNTDRKQLIIMQTNDSMNLTGHVNTCYDYRNMFSKYPLVRQLYAGRMVFPLYSRFMQIGYRG